MNIKMPFNGRKIVGKDERSSLVFPGKATAKASNSETPTWSKEKLSKALTKRIRSYHCSRLKVIHFHYSSVDWGPH